MWRGGNAYNPAAVVITGGTVNGVTSLFAAPSGVAVGVATTGVQLWASAAGFPFASFIDSTRAADNRIFDFTFASGVFAGRAINDAYGAATPWVSVTGGFGAGLTSVVFGAPISAATASATLFNLSSGETGLTAHVGGGQASALALTSTKSVHNVATVGTAADSVALPAATGSGQMHFVKNSAAANSMQVYAVTPGTIDGVATGTGVAIAAGKSRLFIDLAANVYVSLAGA